jgi:hypothetical protein
MAIRWAMIGEKKSNKNGEFQVLPSEKIAISRGGEAKEEPEQANT